MRSLRRLALALLAVAALSAPGLVSTAAASSSSATVSTTGRLCGLDVVWLKSAIQTDRFEIRGGWMAVAKSDTNAVEHLARSLIVSHKMALSMHVALAHRLHIAVPANPSPLQEFVAAQLAKLSGAAFDRGFA